MGRELTKNGGSGIGEVVRKAMALVPHSTEFRGVGFNTHKIDFPTAGPSRISRIGGITLARKPEQVAVASSGIPTHLHGMGVGQKMYGAAIRDAYKDFNRGGPQFFTSDDVGCTSEQARSMWMRLKAKGYPVQEQMKPNFKIDLAHMGSFYKDTPPLTKTADSDKVQQLLSAKNHSDHRRYRKKHEILRRLMMEYPDEFYRDSFEKGVYGITHRPSGFQLHMPPRELPNLYVPYHSEIENQEDTGNNTIMTKAAFIKLSTQAIQRNWLGTPDWQNADKWKVQDQLNEQGGAAGQAVGALGGDIGGVAAGWKLGNKWAANDATFASKGLKTITRLAHEAKPGPVTDAIAETLLKLTGKATLKGLGKLTLPIVGLSALGGLGGSKAGYHAGKGIAQAFNSESKPPTPAFDKQAFIKSAGPLSQVLRSGEELVRGALPGMRQATGRVVGAARLTGPTAAKAPSLFSRLGNHIAQNKGQYARGLGFAGAGYMAGNHQGYGTGYDRGQQGGYNVGQNVGKQIGFQAAQQQAQNTGIFGRLMGNYDFNPNALGDINPTPPSDFFSQAAQQDPNNLGHLRRLIGV